MRVYPSLFCAQPDCIRDEVTASLGADGYHIDVMDGHFVPYLACDPSLVRALKPYVSVPLDVHLMVHNQDQVMRQVMHADSITLHSEGDLQHSLLDCLKILRDKGRRTGVALNPETPASILDPLWGYIDHILVMTVTPGQGGQEFQQDQLPKLRLIRQHIQNLRYPVSLMVDGGINIHTGQQAADAGADTLVVGSYLFKHTPQEYTQVIQQLQAISSCF